MVSNVYQMRQYQGQGIDKGINYEWLGSGLLVLSYLCTACWSHTGVGDTQLPLWACGVLIVKVLLPHGIWG